MNDISIFNKTKINTTVFEKILLDVFNKNDIKESFSIIFVTKKEIKKLNKTYKNTKRPTDVLSFDSDEKDYLGDIFICLNIAFRQAKKYQHSIIREISFLAVHGYLHLKGYDHETQEEEKEMFEIQEQMLANANIER